MSLKKYYTLNPRPRQNTSPQTPAQLVELEKLAASDFDPDDYKNRPDGHIVGDKANCTICRCRYAPGGICGYCRYAVRMIRQAALPAMKKRVVIRCWDEREIEEVPHSCILPSNHEGGHVWTPDHQVQAAIAAEKGDSNAG